MFPTLKLREVIKIYLKKTKTKVSISIWIIFIEKCLFETFHGFETYQHRRHHEIVCKKKHLGVLGLARARELENFYFLDKTSINTHEWVHFDAVPVG